MTQSNDIAVHPEAARACVNVRALVLELETWDGDLLDWFRSTPQVKLLREWLGSPRLAHQPPAACEIEPSREEIVAWLTANCGVGLPHGEAKNQASMLQGLAYVLAQIEGTNQYKVHIGQTLSATSAIRMALEHFARKALSSTPVAPVGEGE